MNISSAPRPDSVSPEIFHSLSPADRGTMAAIRQAMVAGGALPEGTARRGGYDAYMQQTPPYPGVTYEAATVGGVPGWWYRVAGSATDSVLLFLHGGGYYLGSAAAYRFFGGQLAGRVGVDIFAPDYRLAPEHPFPAAVDDAWAAYQGLAALGKRHLALGGDSAGGGLALATLTTAQANPLLPQPHAVVVFSPWVDLALASPSVEALAATDPILTSSDLALAAERYLRGHDAHDPLASPVYGALSADFPPVQVHVSTDELLYDDGRRYAERAQAVGVAVELHVWEGLLHAFPANVGTLEAAALALDCSGNFLRQYLQQ